MNTDIELKVTPFKTKQKTDFEKARNIREIVFIQEQNVEESDEFDELEEESQHFLMELDGKAIGTARWRHIGDKIKLERFAVLKEYRGKKYGDTLLKAVLDHVKPLNKPLYLHAQLKAIPFYARRGFQQVGELFLECDIEHYKMERDSI
ncbi:MAG: GNAT family N-acetyltransferase [Vicingaceae bacterium]